jgi:hypothetical protein
MKVCKSALLLVMLLISGFGWARNSDADFAIRIFEQTNSERISRGLVELALDKDLQRLAADYSRRMCAEGFFDHRDPDGLLVQDRLQQKYPGLIHCGVGENLFMSDRSSNSNNPDYIVRRWLASPEHRKNLLDTEFTHMGVGIYRNGSKLYVTQILASPILRLTSRLPRKLVANESYRLDCEYLSPRSREDFNCSLATPDPNARIKVDLFSYYTGLIPLKCVWRKDGTLTLILDFRAGSGEYKLQAGWGEYYYSDLFTFKVL